MTGRKILVIDDDRDFAESLAEMLQMFGHETATAYSPEGGVAAATTGRFDLAMIDVGLPGCNGADCAMQIQASRNDVTCVLMTGYSADVLDRMGIGRGDLVTLRKPIRPEDLRVFLAE